MKRICGTAVVLAVALCGCTAIRSTALEIKSKRVTKGLTYYLPTKPIVVDVILPAPAKEKAASDPVGAGGAAAAPAGPAAGAGQHLNAVLVGSAPAPQEGGGNGNPAPAAPGTGAAPPNPAAAPGGQNATGTGGGSDKPAEPTGPVTVHVGDAYADYQFGYVLDSRLSLASKESFDIVISSNGLLGSSKTETSSEVSQAFQALAGTAGVLNGKATLQWMAYPLDDSKGKGVVPPVKEGEAPTPEQKIAAKVAAAKQERRQCADGVRRQWVINGVATHSADKDLASGHTPLTIDKWGAGDPAKGFYHFCGYEIMVGKLYKSSTGDETKDFSSKDYMPKEIAGVFYRQSLPYQVDVYDFGSADDKPTGIAFSSTLVFSPDGAPPAYLPIRGTVFSTSNKSGMTFSDGVPTQYSQDTDGELVALFKLPADVLGAYFDAIGGILGKRKAVLANEKDYLDAMNTLASQQIKQAACKQAVSNWDPSQTTDKIKAACGN